MRFFIIQALGLIPSLITIMSIQSEDRKKMLLMQLVCQFMWFIHYGFLGAVTIMFTNAISVLRIFICYFNDRPRVQSRFFPTALCILFMLAGILSWQGPSSLLPCIAMVLTTAALWTRNMRLTRILFVLNSPLMLAYDLSVGSYSTAVIEAAAFCSFVLAVYRFDVRPNRTPHQCSSTNF